MVMGKHKGSRFENVTLNDLRKKFGHTSAWKTKGSGNADDDKGDIVFLNKYMLELKHHKSFSLPQLKRFFKKLDEEAVKENLEPILVFKMNHRPTLMIGYAKFRHHEVEYPSILPFEYWLREIKRFNEL